VSRADTRRAAGRRAGFTLLEVLVALSILGGALLGMASFMARFTRTASTSRVEMTANDLAIDRIEGTVRAQPTYVALDSLQRTEPTIAGAQFAGFARSTKVRRVIGKSPDSVDYKIITVVVTHPRMMRSVKKTVFVGAF
jgi:prepilin-type N-terminal cleavage/methylation domain-containing protein